LTREIIFTTVIETPVLKLRIFNSAMAKKVTKKTQKRIHSKRKHSGWSAFHIAGLVFVLVGVLLILVNYLSKDTFNFKSRAQSGTPPLHWSPPVLVEPTTINLGTGATSTTLDPTKDYIINFPPTKKIGYTWITGGHNIVIKGGYVTTPTGYTNTSERRAVYIKEATGTVHIEGLLIDSSGGGEHDAFAINAPQATVQLQNIRVLDLQGTVNTEHSDIIQPWGGVAELRVDRMTGTTNYQGFYFVQTQPTGFMGTIIAQNVNFVHQANPSQNVPRMLYMVDNSCGSHPASVSFTNVYFMPHSSRPFSEETLPSTTQPSNCLADLTNGVITWPGATWVTGTIIEGTPPDGEFVPDGTVGLNYISPGYEGDATPTPYPTEDPNMPTSTPTDIPTPTNTPIPTSTPTPTPLPDTVSPTVSITSPVNGSSYTKKSVISINATASDDQGVAKVLFYINNALTCTDTAAPYSCSWSTPNTRGTYTLKATAFDTSNNTASHSIQVTLK
jgi:hypothetical protein